MSFMEAAIQENGTAVFGAHTEFSTALPNTVLARGDTQVTFQRNSDVVPNAIDAFVQFPGQGSPLATHLSLKVDPGRPPNPIYF